MFDINQLRTEIEALIRDYPDMVEDEVLRRDMLDSETDLYSALISLNNAAAETKTMISAISNRITDLAARRSRFSRRFDALRELMLKLMQSANLKKIELPDATLSQRASQPQIVGDLDATTLPDNLVNITREPNRVAIRTALLEHREVPGVHLSNAPPTLMVKVK